MTSTSTLTVTCTNTTPYTVGERGHWHGQYRGQPAYVRHGQHDGVRGHQLYKADLSTVWGDATVAARVSGTGTGAAQTLTVNGSVPAQATPAPDTQLHRHRHRLFLRSRHRAYSHASSAGGGGGPAGPTGPAGAATLQISPVMVDMAPQQGASGITLRNPDAMPVYGQVRVYAWEQRDGDDVLLPTDEIQVSPPIIQVPPAAKLVRLVRASREPAAIEKSYRLVIDEIPDPSTPAVNGVVLRLRYSVPVFVAGATPEPRPELSWRAAREGRNGC